MTTFWFIILCAMVCYILFKYGLYMFMEIGVLIIMGCGIISNLEKIYRLLKNNKQ